MKRCNEVYIKADDTQRVGLTIIRDALKIKKGSIVPLIFNSNFIQFYDFFDIAIEAYKNSQKYIYNKILNTLNNQLHTTYIDLEKFSLSIDDIENVYTFDLANMYDNFLDSVENIKIIKKNISKCKSNDFEMVNLYNTADKMHDLLLEILDKIAYKEINILKKDKNAA